MELLTTCWCETSYLLVPAADVIAGRTRSCGRDNCTSPNYATATARGGRK